MYFFLHDLGTKRYKNLFKQHDENGLTLRQYKCCGKVHNRANVLSVKPSFIFENNMQNKLPHLYLDEWLIIKIFEWLNCYRQIRNCLYTRNMLQRVKTVILKQLVFHHSVSYGTSLFHLLPRCVFLPSFVNSVKPM